MDLTSSRRVVTKQTFLKCSCCGNVNTIFRKRHKMKEKNHVKHMYCYKCKEITKFIEVKEDIFLPKWLQKKEANNTAELQ